MSVEKKNGDQCCSLQRRSTYGGGGGKEGGRKEGKKERKATEWKAFLLLSLSTIPLQSVIGRHTEIRTSLICISVLVHLCISVGYQLGCELGLVSVIAHTDCSCRYVGCCVDGGEGGREGWDAWEPPSVARISISTLLRECIFTERCEIFCASLVSQRNGGFFPLDVSSFANSFPALSNSSLSLSAYSAKAKPIRGSTNRMFVWHRRSTAHRRTYLSLMDREWNSLMASID